MGDISRKEFENIGAGQYGCDVLGLGTHKGNWQMAFVIKDATTISTVIGKYGSSDIRHSSTPYSGDTLGRGDVLPSPFTSINVTAGKIEAVRAKEY